MPPAPQAVRIKKYPNRRLYDQTQGRHLTHSDLYDLVAGGTAVTVVDSRSGLDITNVVLLQVLLERDPAKLAAFPPALMHQVIRANEQMLQSFVARYFGQVMDAFLAMQRQFETLLGRSAPGTPIHEAPGPGAAAWSPLPGAPPNPIFDWAMSMMRPGAGAPPTPQGGPPPPDADRPDRPDDELDEMRARLDALTTELHRLQSRGKKAPTPTRSKPSKKKKPPRSKK